MDADVFVKAQLLLDDLQTSLRKLDQGVEVNPPLVQSSDVQPHASASPSRWQQLKQRLATTDDTTHHLACLAASSPLATSQARRSVVLASPTRHTTATSSAAGLSFQPVDTVNLQASLPTQHSQQSKHSHAATVKSPCQAVPSISGYRGAATSTRQLLSSVAPSSHHLALAVSTLPIDMAHTPSATAGAAGRKHTATHAHQSMSTRPTTAKRTTATTTLTATTAAESLLRHSLELESLQRQMAAGGAGADAAASQRTAGKPQGARLRSASSSGAQARSQRDTSGLSWGGAARASVTTAHVSVTRGVHNAHLAPARPSQPSLEQQAQALLSRVRKLAMCPDSSLGALLGDGGGDAVAPASRRAASTNLFDWDQTTSHTSSLYSAPVPGSMTSAWQDDAKPSSAWILSRSPACQQSPVLRGHLTGAVAWASPLGQQSCPKTRHPLASPDWGSASLQGSWDGTSHSLLLAQPSGADAWTHMPPSPQQGQLRRPGHGPLGSWSSAAGLGSKAAAGASVAWAAEGARGVGGDMLSQMELQATMRELLEGAARSSEMDQAALSLTPVHHSDAFEVAVEGPEEQDERAQALRLMGRVVLRAWCSAASRLRRARRQAIRHLTHCRKRWVMHAWHSAAAAAAAAACSPEAMEEGRRMQLAARFRRMYVLCAVLQWWRLAASEGRARKVAEAAMLARAEAEAREEAVRSELALKFRRMYVQFTVLTAWACLTKHRSHAPGERAAGHGDTPSQQTDMANLASHAHPQMDPLAHAAAGSTKSPNYDQGQEDARGAAWLHTPQALLAARFRRLYTLHRAVQNWQQEAVRSRDERRQLVEEQLRRNKIQGLLSRMNGTGAAAGSVLPGGTAGLTAGVTGAATQGARAAGQARGMKQAAPAAPCSAGVKAQASGREAPGVNQARQQGPTAGPGQRERRQREQALQEDVGARWRWTRPAPTPLVAGPPTGPVPGAPYAFVNSAARGAPTFATEARAAARRRAALTALGQKKREGEPAAASRGRQRRAPCAGAGYVSDGWDAQSGGAWSTAAAVGVAAGPRIRRHSSGGALGCEVGDSGSWQLDKQEQGGTLSAAHSTMPVACWGPGSAQKHTEPLPAEPAAPWDSLEERSLFAPVPVGSPSRVPPQIGADVRDRGVPPVMTTYVGSGDTESDAAWSSSRSTGQNPPIKAWSTAEVEPESNLQQQRRRDPAPSHASSSAAGLSSSQGARPAQHRRASELYPGSRPGSAAVSDDGASARDSSQPPTGSTSAKQPAGRGKLGSHGPVAATLRRTTMGWADRVQSSGSGTLRRATAGDGLSAGAGDAEELQRARKAEASRRRREAEQWAAVDEALQQEALVLSQLHYQRNLLLRWGLRPWRALIDRSSANELAAVACRLAQLKRRTLDALREALVRKRWSRAASHAVAVAAGRQAAQARVGRDAIWGLRLWAVSGRMAKMGRARRAIALLVQAVWEARDAAHCAAVWQSRRMCRRALASWREVAAAESSARLLAELQARHAEEQAARSTLLAYCLAAWQRASRQSSADRAARMRRHSTLQKVGSWIAELQRKRQQQSRRPGGADDSCDDQDFEFLRQHLVDSPGGDGWLSDKASEFGVDEAVASGLGGGLQEGRTGDSALLDDAFFRQVPKAGLLRGLGTLEVRDEWRSGGGEEQAGGPRGAQVPGLLATAPVAMTAGLEVAARKVSELQAHSQAQGPSVQVANCPLGLPPSGRGKPASLGAKDASGARDQALKALKARRVVVGSGEGGQDA